MPELIAPLEQLIQAGVRLSPAVEESASYVNLCVGFGAMGEFFREKGYHIGLDRQGCGTLDVAYDAKDTGKDSTHPRVVHLRTWNDVGETIVVLSNWDRYAIHHSPSSLPEEVVCETVSLADYLSRVKELDAELG
ncbi:hypothetical protein HYW21_04770 [Candidatus Woesearchaeota archaeon]|nr:hypothetical protein [Candidatus Woesearchaeota archaeon]